MLELALFVAIIALIWFTVRRAWKRETLDEIEKRTRADLEQLKAERATKAEKKREKDRSV